MARNDGRTLKIQVVGDIKDIKKDVAEVNKSIGGLTKGAKLIGAAVAGAFAVDSVVDFAKTAIGAASDLQESISKVNVVFGDSADEILKWSETSSRSVLLSKQAALEAAGTFGNLFDALGLTEDATTSMSKGIVQLAADLGSFNNVGTEEVLDALKSGLLGEAEPMRKFGSALSAARVEAYALAQGWVKNKNQLTEAQKVQARYELILQDTVNAQGDVARSSGNLAAQQKQLDANMENLTATIGQALIGPLADFTSWINDLVGPTGSGGKFESAIVGLQKMAEAAKDVAKAQDPGAWFLSGTVFDSAIDGLNNMNDAVLDTLIPQSKWVEQLELQGRATGATRDELLLLAKVVKDSGGDYETFRRIVVQTARNTLDAGEDFGTGAAAATEATTEMKAGIASLARATGKIPGDVSDAFLDVPKSIKDAKKPIRAAMAEIEWALKHPLDQAELDAFYDRKLKAAYKKLRQAQKTGNARAIALARQLVRDLKGEMNALNLSIIWTNFTPHGRHGANRDAAGSIGRRPRKKNSPLHNPNSSWQPGDQGVEGRAMGGPVTRGMPYIVGEHRPELFVPETNGRIMPSVGSGPINITVNGYVGSEEQLGRVINRHLAAFVQRGGRLGYR